METKKLTEFTAHDFTARPAIVYRTADVEGVVKINHQLYPDKDILLVSKPLEQGCE